MSGTSDATPYSRRVRTPKRFFDDVSEETSGKKKKPKNDKKIEEITTPKSMKKKGRPKASNKDLKKSLPEDDQDTPAVQPGHENLPNEVEEDITPVNIDSAIQEPYKEIGETQEDNACDVIVEQDDKNVKSTPTSSRRRKGRPQKSLPELDKSPERIPADKGQVKAVKEMVDSVRQNRSRNSSPVPKEFYSENSPNKSDSKLALDTSTDKNVTDEKTYNALSKVAEKLVQDTNTKSNGGDTDISDTGKETEELTVDKAIGHIPDNSELEPSSCSPGLGTNNDSTDKEPTSLHSVKETNYDGSLKITKEKKKKKISKLDISDSSALDPKEGEPKNTPKSSNKKRGRKRKQNDEESDKTIESEDLVSNSTTVSKFGRKRKSLTYSDILKDESGDETKETTNGKKRGRPKKANLKTKQSELDADDLDSSVDITKDSKNNSVALSRSGRKRAKVDYSAVDKNNEDDDGEGNGRKKKGRRGRKSKTVADDDDDFGGEGNEPKKKGKKGRRSKAVADDDDDEDDGVSDDKTPKKGRKSLPKDPNKEIKCPRCDYKTFLAYSMKNHCACLHQLLWSREKPEGSFEKSDLSAIFKIKRYLNCPRCDKRINQLFYYYHHLEWCGRENETYTCEMCGNAGLKLIWKKVHGRECVRVRQDMEKERQEAKRQRDLEFKNINPADYGGKRRAAKKAMDILHDLSIGGDDGDAFEDDCNVRDPDADIKEHSGDDDDDDADEGDDDIDEESDANFDDPEGVLGGKNEMRRRRPMISRGQWRASKLGIYTKYWNVYDLMKAYSKENFSKMLFTTWLPRKQDCTALSLSECEAYIPKPSSSVKFKLHKSDDPSSLSPYESITAQGHSVFYTGTSVWKLAWCPMPLENKTEQYIALVGKLHPQQSFSSTWERAGPGCIQLWGTGICTNAMCSEGKPRLQYTIVHDYGQATAIKWCPSGCYQSSKQNVDEGYLQRLGLLAVSFKDGSVRIFSLPHPLELSESEAPPTYRFPPVASLVPHRKWQDSTAVCSCFDWCDMPGHRKIAAGYADGTVRLFCLSTQSPLLRLQSPTDAPTILPYHRFHPLGCLVRSVRFYGRSEKRVVVGSEEFENLFLDTDDSTFPLYMDVPFNLTLNFDTSIWHPGVFQVSDDSYAIGCNKSRYIEPSSMTFYVQHSGKVGERKDEIITFILFSQNASAWDISVSNWLNYVVTADNRGIVMGIPLQDMTISVPDQKTYRYRQVLIKTDTISTDQPDDTEKSDNVEGEEADCDKNVRQQDAGPAGTDHPVDKTIHTDDNGHSNTVENSDAVSDSSTGGVDNVISNPGHNTIENIDDNSEGKTGENSANTRCAIQSDSNSSTKIVVTQNNLKPKQNLDRTKAERNSESLDESKKSQDCVNQDSDGNKMCHGEKDVSSCDSSTIDSCRRPQDDVIAESVVANKQENPEACATKVYNSVNNSSKSKHNVQSACHATDSCHKPQDSVELKLVSSSADNTCKPQAADVKLGLNTIAKCDKTQAYVNPPDTSVRAKLDISVIHTDSSITNVRTSDTSVNSSISVPNADSSCASIENSHSISICANSNSSSAVKSSDSTTTSVCNSDSTTTSVCNSDSTTTSVCNSDSGTCVINPHTSNTQDSSANVTHSDHCGNLDPNISVTSDRIIDTDNVKQSAKTQKEPSCSTDSDKLEISDKTQETERDKTVKRVNNLVLKKPVQSSSKTGNNSVSVDVSKRKEKDSTVTVVRTSDHSNNSKNTSDNTPKDTKTPVTMTTHSEKNVCDPKEDGQLNFDHLRETTILEYKCNFINPPRAPVNDAQQDVLTRFPITALNAVSLNPNHRQCLWLAYGGQNGLVHVVNIYHVLPKALKKTLEEKDKYAGKKSSSEA